MTIVTSVLVTCWRGLRNSPRLLLSGDCNGLRVLPLCGIFGQNVTIAIRKKEVCRQE